LYHISVKAAKDNDKVKCNAVRAIGSILYLCPQKHILSDTTLGLNALINCAVLGNDMKVSLTIILNSYNMLIYNILINNKIIINLLVTFSLK